MADGLPARFRIGAELLALDDRDAGVPQACEMVEGELGGAAVVECDVGHIFLLQWTGDCNRGQVRYLMQNGVDSDYPVDRSLFEHSHRTLDEICAVVVAVEKVEVSSLEQGLFDTCENKSCVAFRNLGNEDTNCH